MESGISNIKHLYVLRTAIATRNDVRLQATNNHNYNNKPLCHNNSIIAVEDIFVLLLYFYSLFLAYTNISVPGNF